MKPCSLLCQLWWPLTINNLSKLIRHFLFIPALFSYITSLHSEREAPSEGAWTKPWTAHVDRDHASRIREAQPTCVLWWWFSSWLSLSLASQKWSGRRLLYKTDRFVFSDCWALGSRVHLNTKCCWFWTWQITTLKHQPQFMGLWETQKINPSEWMGQRKCTPALKTTSCLLQRGSGKVKMCQQLHILCRQKQRTMKHLFYSFINSHNPVRDSIHSDPAYVVGSHHWIAEWANSSGLFLQM